MFESKMTNSLLMAMDRIVDGRWSCVHLMKMSLTVAYVFLTIVVGNDITNLCLT